MLFQKKYKFDNSNTLILLADANKINKRENEIELTNRLINHVSENKGYYAKFTVAILPMINGTCYAESLGLDPIAKEIIDILTEFAKWGCAAKGIMNMGNEMLQGANLKEALAEGAQYFIFYIVLLLYPEIFNKVHLPKK